MSLTLSFHLILPRFQTFSPKNLLTLLPHHDQRDHGAANNGALNTQIDDDHFARNIVPNSNDELAEFLQNIVCIHSRRRIDDLIPKIQRYALKLYGPEVVQLDDDHFAQQHDPQSGGQLGSWLGALCLERTSLTAQQETVRVYLREKTKWNEVSEWELRSLLMTECGLSGVDSTAVIQELYLRHRVQQEMESESDQRALSELATSILSDLRSKQMEQIVTRCSESAQMGIDETYFLAEIVVEDDALRQFLKQNIGHRPEEDIEPLMGRIRKYLEDINILRFVGVVVP